MIRALPTEVWMLILPLLQKPVPPPLSRPPRSAIRQPWLARAARCCRAFAEICYPLLYTHIISDDLPALIVAGIMISSARRRFALTETLRIEYSSKRADGGYEELLDLGGEKWDLLELNPSGAERFMTEECLEELGNLQRALTGLKGYGPAKVFPRLKSTAISSIYGRGSDVWVQAEKVLCVSERLDTVKRIHECADTYRDVLSSIPTLLDHCSRETQGPLCASPSLIFLARRTPSIRDDFNRTYHFSLGPDHPPFPLGTKVTWSSDNPSTSDCSKIMKETLAAVQYVTEYRDVKESEQGVDWPPVDLTIYCSAATSSDGAFLSSCNHSGGRLSREDQYRQCQFIGSFAVSDDGGREKPDKICWYPSYMTPTCKACGSGVPA